MKDIIIVIPSYEPSTGLCDLVKALKKDFRHVIVVDDGSNSAEHVFAELSRAGEVTILRHDTNRGKGAALKTAFAYILANGPGAAGVVTVDADGQHLVEDVRRVAAGTLDHPDRLTLGVRSFSGKVPFRSRLGNLWTRIEFFLLTGVHILDTQTGLRGIPASWLPDMLALDGERYEYESAMLVFGAKAEMKPAQIPISTVYLDGNGSSHFRPLADTLKTQSALISSALRIRRKKQGS